MLLILQKLDKYIKKKHNGGIKMDVIKYAIITLIEPPIFKIGERL
jgi:hypothetical protein